MESICGPIPSKGRLQMPVLPPWPGAPSCTLAVPGGDGCTLLEGSQETCFKLGLQGQPVGMRKSNG